MHYLMYKDFILLQNLCHIEVEIPVLHHVRLSKRIKYNKIGVILWIILKANINKKRRTQT